MPDNLNLVIGGIGLPVFAALLLWVLHKVGMSAAYDQIASFVIALVFTAAVVVLNFFPQYTPYIAGAVTFIYTLLTSLQNLVPNTVIAIAGSPEKKAVLAAKLKG